MKTRFVIEIVHNCTHTEHDIMVGLQRGLKELEDMSDGGVFADPDINATVTSVRVKKLPHTVQVNVDDLLK